MDQSNYPSQDHVTVYQGYGWICNRHHYTTLQLRIMYRIIEYAQSEINGLLLSDHRCKINHNLRDVTIALPVSAVLPDGSHHHDDVYKAFVSIQRDIIEINDGNLNNWYATALLSNVQIVRNTGIVYFTVSKVIWDRILDFTRGFRAVDLRSILSLKLPSSIRLYQLISGQRSPVRYSVASLKQYFGATDKYTQTADFVRKVLQPAARECGKICPWSTRIKPIKTGKKITHIALIPYEIPTNKVESLRSLLPHISPSQLVDPEVYRYLRYNLDFSSSELSHHKELLDNCTRNIPNLIDFLSSLSGRLRQGGISRGKGWIISAMRSELKKYTNN